MAQAPGINLNLNIVPEGMKLVPNNVYGMAPWDVPIPQGFKIDIDKTLRFFREAQPNDFIIGQLFNVFNVGAGKDFELWKKCNATDTRRVIVRPIRQAPVSNYVLTVSIPLSPEAHAALIEGSRYAFAANGPGSAITPPLMPNHLKAEARVAVFQATLANISARIERKTHE